MRLLVPASLAGLSLLLLGAIGYESVAPLGPVVIEIPRLPKRTPAIAPPANYALPDEALFADIDARPMFSAARKPLAEPAQANAALSAASDFSLIGVITGGERSVALIHRKSTNVTTNAALGETVDGWNVVRIEPTAVTLRANGADAVIALEGPATMPPAPPLQSAPVQPSPPPPSLPPPASATPPAPQPTPAPAAPPKPVASTALAQPDASTAPPTAPAKPGHHPTIAPEALKGAFIDPTTGEPTL